MKRGLVATLALLLCVGQVFAADKDSKAKAQAKKAPDALSPARKQYSAILKKRAAERRAFNTAYSRAKTKAEKNKIFNTLYPRPGKYAAEFFAIGKKYPKDPVAVKALIEVVSGLRGRPMAKDALKMLTKDHYAKKEIGAVCQTLIYSPSTQSENLLRLILAKNPHKTAKAMACYSLGKYRKQMARMAQAFKDHPGRIAAYKNFYGAEFVKQVTSSSPKEMLKEAELLFVRVTKEFGDVKYFSSSIKQRAEGELFELRNLIVGKVAPDITGKDIDGVQFKLSDYRGKVVVLDFWGDW